MKTKIFILLVLILLITSCNNEEMISFHNLQLIDHYYYLEVNEEFEEIDFSDYVVCSGIYLITDQNGNYYHSDDRKRFKLDVGSNQFAIEFNDEKFFIIVNRYFSCNISILDTDKTIIIQKTIVINDKLPTDEIIALINEKLGYQWTGHLLHSTDLSEFNAMTIDEIKISKNIYIIPVYEPLEYQITFKNYSETINQVIKTNELIEFPLPEDVPGYRFLGWYANDKLVDEGAIYDYTMGTTFEAVYEVQYFNITYHYDEQIKNETIKYGDSFELFIPSKEGALFLHWDYNGEIFQGGVWTYTNDITLNAVWKEMIINLNLETYGGNVNSVVTFDEEGIIDLPIPILEGYVFKYWCTDPYFNNKIAQLNVNDYQNERMYAYYELDSTFLKEQVGFTMHNEHAENYDEIALFDNSITNMASLYWHKILIKENNGEYFVSNIGKSGDKISSLGDYDYLLMAYSSCPEYNKMINLDCNIGDVVSFIINPNQIDNGKVVGMISFSTPDYSNELENIRAYLDDLYGNLVTVKDNLTLVTNYNNFNITWKSSNNSVISLTGIFHAPAVTREVTLTAYISEIEIYHFTVIAEGINGESNALATGYIYTPYNTITQNAMNTLDIIYCAFLDIDKDGNWTNLSTITSRINNYIKEKASLSGTKIVISVNESISGAFSSVAANPTLRDKLASNIVAVIKDLDLDGVDIDWETPASSEAGNFTLLMEAIYQKVKTENEDYLVTAAIGGGKWAPPKYDLTNSVKYLDYINLMTYSMATSSSYYQNALYPSTKGATLVSCSIDESIKIYNDLSVPNSKILVGIPFYLTVQTDAGGPGSKVGTGKSVWYSYLNTTYQISDTMKEYFDEECGVPYRYDALNRIFISFENERSIMVKCEYINTHGLAGIMYWQYGQDVDDVLSNAIAKYINK